MKTTFQDKVERTTYTAEAITGLRKRSGLSKAKFARRVGVSERTLYRWESSESRPIRPRGKVLRALGDLAAGTSAKTTFPKTTFPKTTLPKTTLPKTTLQDKVERTAPTAKASATKASASLRKRSDHIATVARRSATPKKSARPKTPIRSRTENALQALSPLDGRYAEQCQELTPLFSEGALFRQRLRVEIAWFRHLAGHAALPEFPALSSEEEAFLRTIADRFDASAMAHVKKIEDRLRHDLKAVEYYLKERLAEHPRLGKVLEFVHFGCTSEDINNLAYALSLEEARATLLMPALDQLLRELAGLAGDWAELPMLGRTHGQAASPTTLGKELRVFERRLRRQSLIFQEVPVLGKLNGAVGNYNALLVAYPGRDWPGICRGFVESLGLGWNPCTTQIEPHDWIAEYCHALVRCSRVLLDLCGDLWGYIALGYFRQQARPGEVGSSTMPHKINPIHFENAEGNLGLAGSLLEHLARSLPVSRWQRDLSDSTTLRNLGVALGHWLLACKNCSQGLDRLQADPEKMRAELQGSWEVLAEAVQTVMRCHGLAKPYERLKKLTRGGQVDAARLRRFIHSLSLPESALRRLLELTPEGYTGNAATQARAAQEDKTS